MLIKMLGRREMGSVHLQTAAVVAVAAAAAAAAAQPKKLQKLLFVRLYRYEDAPARAA